MSRTEQPSVSVMRRLSSSLSLNLSPVASVFTGKSPLGENSAYAVSAPSLTPIRPPLKTERSKSYSAALPISYTSATFMPRSRPPATPALTISFAPSAEIANSAADAALTLPMPDTITAYLRPPASPNETRLPRTVSLRTLESAATMLCASQSIAATTAASHETIAFIFPPPFFPLCFREKILYRRRAYLLSPPSRPELSNLRRTSRNTPPRRRFSHPALPSRRP